MQNLSIQTVMKNRESYNLALPFVETQQVNPFYKMSASLLYVDISERASQVFKVGSRSCGNGKWEDLYSLTKPFLNRLATEAGIQFMPGSGSILGSDALFWYEGVHADRALIYVK